MTILTMRELDALDAEEYSNFLIGGLLVSDEEPELPDEFLLSEEV